MRISDWSSDVCSSDLSRGNPWQQVAEARRLSRPGAVAQDRGLPAQRRLGSPVRIRRPGGAGEHAVALLLHPARRSRHRDLDAVDAVARSEEHTSELQSLMRISYAVFCLKKKNNQSTNI